MNSSFLKWSAAIVISVFVHAGLSGFFALEEPTAKIAGGAPMEIASFGQAFADSQAAGTPDTVMEPISQPEEAVQPETLDAVEPVETETIETVPVEVRDAEPVVEQPVEVASLPPETELVPTEEAFPTPDLSAVVVPTIRPEPTAEPKQVVKPKKPKKQKTEAKKPKAKPKPVAKKEKPKKTRPTAGNQGQQQANTRAGQQAENTSSRAKKSGAGKRAQRAGNAKVSNYPGKIQRKLRRAKVRPSGTRKRGNVVVSFTVSKSGSVSGVRIARSSGVAALDKAAIATVKRAVPFPQIPDAAGRSKWAFSIPIRFN